MTLNSKALARVGQLCLEEAVLATLRRSPQRWLWPSDVSGRLGLRYDPDSRIVRPVLEELKRRGRVRYDNRPGRGYWRIA